MNRFTTGKGPRRERFSGPWCANPWLDARNIGPRNHQGSKPQVLQASLELPPLESAGIARKEPSQEQRNALNRWKGEGGQN